MPKSSAKKSKAEDEKARLHKLFGYEREMARLGFRTVAGLDEAGRGPLAGPVVAAAVVLPLDIFIEGLNDSKRLSKRERERIYEKIASLARAFGVGVVQSERIDEVNIYRATCEAMAMALASMQERPDFLLVDGLRLPAVAVGQLPIKRGDSLSASIAAASIMAKVIRDRIMTDYDRIYPLYGFASHKGYATAAHLDALRKNGPCPIHRHSFKPVYELCVAEKQRHFFEVDGYGSA